MNNRTKFFLIISIIFLLLLNQKSISASTQAIIMDVQLESQEYNKSYNSTHFYSNFSFSLTSQKHFIFIASVNGLIMFDDHLKGNISLIPQNRPLAIGLEPLIPVQLQYYSEYNKQLINRENITILLNVNFQLFVTSEENFGKIVTKSIEFNKTNNKLQINAPAEAVYYSYSYSEESSSTNGFTIFVIFFLGSSYLVRKIKTKKEASSRSKN